MAWYLDLVSLNIFTKKITHFLCLRSMTSLTNLNYIESQSLMAWYWTSANVFNALAFYLETNQSLYIKRNQLSDYVRQIQYTEPSFSVFIQVRQEESLLLLFRNIVCSTCRTFVLDVWFLRQWRMRGPRNIVIERNEKRCRNVQ